MNLDLNKKDTTEEKIKNSPQIVSPTSDINRISILTLPIKPNE